MKILVNSCISKMDSIRMRVRGKMERGRQAGSQFMRAARIIVSIKYSKRSNIAVMLERWKTVSKSSRIDETKSF